ERLRKMLLEQGSFEKLEVAVKQWHEKRSKEEAEGGYVTKQWLMDNESYTQQMADDAFEWARQHGKLRKNKVHGTEEADIPLREKWSSMKESGRRTEFAGKAEMEAPC
ncbi:OGG1, partial [Symbiodinium pilosum]